MRTRVTLTFDLESLDPLKQDAIEEELHNRISLFDDSNWFADPDQGGAKLDINSITVTLATSGEG